jgi:hypothetical protein
MLAGSNYQPRTRPLISSYLRENNERQRPRIIRLLDRALEESVYSSLPVAALIADSLTPHRLARCAQWLRAFTPFFTPTERRAEALHRSFVSHVEY